jgi:hypothetical protein
MGYVGISYGHWSIFQLFGIFWGPFVFFMLFWYKIPRFGIFYHEKSGNPGIKEKHGS